MNGDLSLHLINLVPPYGMSDWYWFIGGDETQVWSSRLMDFVSIDDPIYAIWKSSGLLPASAISVEQLTQMLAEFVS